MIFNKDTFDKELLKVECKLKKETHKYALNKQKYKEIPRYTDKYSDGKLTNKQKIKSLIYHEILPKELQDALLKHKIVVEKVDDLETEVSSVSEVIESNEEDNDYNKNYYDEEEEEEGFVDEEEKGEEDYD